MILQHNGNYVVRSCWMLADRFSYNYIMEFLRKKAGGICDHGAERLKKDVRRLQVRVAYQMKGKVEKVTIDCIDEKEQRKNVLKK